MEDTSKSYTIPKPKKARILTPEKNMKKTYMIPCNICGNDIAVKATSCPHCGDTKSKNLFWKIIKIIFIVLAVLFIIQVILASIGIAILDDQMDKTIEQLDKQNKQMIKNINNIKPPTINLPNTYQSKMKEDERRRQLAILRKRRELQRLQQESENAKTQLKAQIQFQ